MQEMTNQGVDNCCERKTDFPANLLARILKMDPAITFVGMDDDGDIGFSVPMRGLALNRCTWNRNPILRTAFFADLAGETLVRKHLPQFADRLARLEPQEYDRLVNRYTHRHFGLMIDEHDVLQFRFHVSFIQQILTEDLGDVFGS